MITLASEVKRLRERRGFTQAQLAAWSHLGMNFVWSVENDRDMNWCQWQVQRLARVLRVPEESLLALIPPNRRRFGHTDHAA